MSGSRRPGKPHIRLGGNPFGPFGPGCPTVTADGDVNAQRIGAACDWLRKREVRVQSTERRPRAVRFKVEPGIFEIDDTPPEMGR